MLGWEGIYAGGNKHSRPSTRLPRSVVELVPFYIMYSYRLWKTEYAKRTQFLQQVKESTWNHIIENVLPISLVVTKYKPREEQVELHSHNKQSDV